MHRTQAIALLTAHRGRALSGGESRAVDDTLRFIGEHGDCLLRSCLEGHLTGSAWVVSPDRRRTLLTEHRKLGKWLQLGGHADGEPDLLAVALREAREESGLCGLVPVGTALFDVDRHWIPARGAEPAHWHHDLRFMIEADPAEPLKVSGESRALAWVAVAAAAAAFDHENVAGLERLLGQPIAQHRGLVLEPDATVHQLDGVVAEYHHRALHLANFVVPLAGLHIDTGIVRRQPMHPVRQVENGQ